MLFETGPALDDDDEGIGPAFALLVFIVPPDAPMALDETVLGIDKAVFGC